MMRPYAFALVSLLALHCSSQGGQVVTDAADDTTALATNSTVGSVSVEGAIAKGPFIAGSRIDASALDAKTLAPTGESFRTDTLNVLGEFSLDLPVGAIDLQTSGFWYNELTSRSSDAPIEMRALVNVSKSTTALYVNPLTHLARRRAEYLATKGAPPLALDEAIAQAEDEVRSALTHLASPDKPADGTAVNLLGGADEDTGYLLALSCMLIQAATDNAGGSIDAALQSILNDIALDLEADGTLDLARAEELAAAVRRVDPLACQSGLQAFIDDQLSESMEAPDPLAGLDYDGDGLPDLTDGDADGDGVLAADDLPEEPELIPVLETEGLVRDGSGQIWHLFSGPPNLVEDIGLSGVEHFAVDATGGIAQISAGALTYVPVGKTPVAISVPSTAVNVWTSEEGTTFVILGQGGRLYSFTPSASTATRLGTAEGVVDYTAGTNLGLARLTDGQLVMVRIQDNWTSPTLVDISNNNLTFSQFAASGQNFVALDTNGAVWWLGAFNCGLWCVVFPSPVALPPGSVVKQLSGGAILLEDGTVYEMGLTTKATLVPGLSGVTGLGTYPDHFAGIVIFDNGDVGLTTSEGGEYATMRIRIPR